MSDTRDPAVDALKTAAEQSEQLARQYRHRAARLDAERDKLIAQAMEAEENARSCRLGAVVLTNLGKPLIAETVPPEPCPSHDCILEAGHPEDHRWK